jgi:hypothetical protein
MLLGGGFFFAYVQWKKPMKYPMAFASLLYGDVSIVTKFIDIYLRGKKRTCFLLKLLDVANVHMSTLVKVVRGKSTFAICMLRTQPKADKEKARDSSDTPNCKKRRSGTGIFFCPMHAHRRIEIDTCIRHTENHGTWRRSKRNCTNRNVTRCLSNCTCASDVTSHSLSLCSLSTPT